MKCALAAAILLCAFLRGADSQETQNAPLHRLNVAALDAQGHPATGLRSADFRLLEDGKPRDIAFFRFTGDQDPPAKPGEGEYSNRAAARHPTVILIDLLTDRILSDWVIGQEVADALKNTESSEDLYLYILTARGELYPIHPLPKPDTETMPAAEPWTRNIAPMLQGALRRLAGRRPVDDRDIQVRFDLTVNALRDLASRMAQISGRKNLVWVTHGNPIAGYSISGQSVVDFTNPLRWLCEELERAQIVMYPVEQSMAGAGAAVGTQSAEFLEEFTGITGGRLYSSDRAGAAIRQARTDSRANYQIAYYPGPLNLDGKHHKIRVICGRKGVHLQTEAGFYAVAPVVSPGHLAANALRSRELPLEVETASHSPFDAVEIGIRASVSPDPIDAMLFQIHIDTADLLPRPARDPAAGKVWVAFVCYGEGPKPVAHPGLVSLTTEQLAAAKDGEIEVRYTMPLQQALRKVRAIVFDAELGAAGSVTIPIQR